MTKITELTNQLGEILLPRGYKKAGKLFYRVQGDGVVVFFCFEYDPGDRGHQLCFGIDSLYNSELKTPKELNLNPTFSLLTKQELQEYSFNNWCSITPPSNELLQSIVANDSSVFYKCLYKGAEEQNQKRNAREFDILRENDFLARIDKLHDFTQVEAFMIEMAERDGIWHETDRQRFFYAYLSVGRYADAVWAFRFIEKQNYWAIYNNSIYFDSYDFELQRKESETYLTPRRKFVRLLEENKIEEVQERLQQIYAHNLATFGVRKKRTKKTTAANEQPAE